MANRDPRHLCLQAVVTDREVIRGSIESLLSQIGATNTFEPIDQQFYDLCCKRAIDKGYPMSTDPTVPSLRPCMNVGAQLAYYMYAHLENKETQMFIALYTAFMVYVDSAFVHDNQNLRVFIERFIRGKRQMDPVLQSLSHLLKEIPDHWEPVVASLILTGSLNFINAPTLEYQTQGMKVESSFSVILEYLMNLSLDISPCRWLCRLYPSIVWSSGGVLTNVISSKHTFGKLYPGPYARLIYLYTS